jgi:hypothetical protein
MKPTFVIFEQAGDLGEVGVNAAHVVQVVETKEARCRLWLSTSPDQDYLDVKGDLRTVVAALRGGAS